MSSLRRAFASKMSFSEAIGKAKVAGYTPVMQVFNAKKRQFVVFGRLG